MKCRGCEQEKKLVRSHAIPEAFFRGLRMGELAPKIHTNTPGIYPKKAPIGIYDEETLCSDCENLFQAVDDFGAKFLLQDKWNFSEIADGDRLVGYHVKDVDNKKLKKFFMAVLWRMSISNHFFYRKVSLGMHECKLKSILWTSPTFVDI